MTVGELIAELEKIEDKNLRVGVSVDMSTCEHDALRRILGSVVEINEIKPNYPEVVLLAVNGVDNEDVSIVNCDECGRMIGAYNEDYICDECEKILCGACAEWTDSDGLSICSKCWNAT